MKFLRNLSIGLLALLSAGVLLKHVIEPANAVGLVTQSGPRLFVASGGSDGTPNAFSFTDQTNVSTSSTITSAGVTINGIDTTISCANANGTLDVGADGSFSTPRSVTNGQSIRARHTSSASNSTQVDSLVTCGGVSDTFSSTTAAGGSGFTPNAGFAITSGTVANGNVVTITKSAGGFGTKPGGGKPRRWFPFESDFLPDATYSRDTGSMTTQTGATFQSTVKPTNAAGAIKQTLIQGNAFVFSNSPQFTFNSTNKFYMFVERRHDHTNNNSGSTTVAGSGSDAINLKTIRVWPLGGSAAGLPDGYIATGNNLCIGFMEQTSSQTNPSGTWCALVFGANGVQQGTTFLSTEHWFRASSSGGANDGKWAHARNSLWGPDLSDNWVTHSGGTAEQSVYIDELSNGNPGGNIYYHSLYFDDSWAHLILSPEPTYKTSGATGTQYLRTIQIPSSWSDTDITFLVRQGQLSSMSGAHLYIQTDSGTVLDAGTVNDNNALRLLGLPMGKHAANDELFHTVLERNAA